MEKAGIKRSLLALVHKPPPNYDLVVTSSLRFIKVSETRWEERRERKMRELRICGV